MNWQYAPFTFPLFAATAISAGLALYSWKRRPAVGAAPFALLMLAVAEWSLGYALRLGSADLPTKLFWARVRYLGIVVVPAAWLAFVLQYTGREKWLTPRNVAMLAIEPLVTLVLVWTNDAHHLIWSDIRLETSGPLLVWSATHGVGFWTHAVYSYLLLLLSTLLLIQALIRSPRLYRVQAGVLLIGALMPLVGNVLSVFGLVPFPLDLTPFAFTVAGLLVAWDILRLRLFDIVPVARSAVVDNMNGGVLVLDVQNRVVDINPAAQNIIGRPASDVIGQRIEQIVVTRTDLIERYRDVTEARTEITLGEGEAQRDYELQISPLHDQYGRLSGRLVVLHDTTERKRAEAGLLAQKQLFESLVAMARATAKHPSLEATLQSAVNMAATLTGAEHGSVFLLDGTGVVTHSVLARGEALPEQRQAIVREVMEGGLAGWVVRQRQPALIHDASRDDRWLALLDAPYVARSALAIPIVSGSAVLGVLTLTHSKPNHFSTEHAYMIQSAADQMTMAVRNAQMYDEQRRLADRQTKLYEALRTVGQHLDPETIAHAAVEAVARLTDWPIVTILLPDDTATHLVDRASAGALSAAWSKSLSVDQGITGRAFRTAQTQYVPDISVDPDYVNFSSIILSELAVPLRRGERVLGVLDVASDRPAALNADDILLAKSLAEAIALALDNARLYAEIRQYADAIADERSRLQALIESSRDGIVLIGMDYHMLVVNAPALRLLRLTGQPEDWVNRSIQDALTILEHHAPRFVQAIRDEIRRVMKDESPGEGESEVPPRAVHWLNLPVMAGTTRLGRLLVLRDVTEERLVERMRDDLVHAMVHDLRNPLTVISGALSFLEDSVANALPPNQLELWEIAQNSTEAMLQLVRAILEMSRLESQQIPLDHRLTSLADLAAGVLDSQLPLAVDKGLHLESDVPPTLPPAWVDAGLIERVLKNLVGNAIKFTPAEGTVRVTAKADIAERSQLRVSVSDTGPGIPPELQDRLFQKFVTGQHTGRGSGLGLAFCRMVIEAHGTRIWVEDTSENGTTFTFTLPLPPALES